MQLKIKVSKVDAARRQLDCALRLWFADGDPVAIHTLLFASFDILSDLNAKHGDKESTLLASVQRLAKPEHVEEVMRFFKQAWLFFKHADRDPHRVLDFNPEANDYLFPMVMRALATLGEQSTDPQRAFLTWWSIHKPQLVREEFQPERFLSAEKVESIRRLPKREFLNVFMESLANSRRRT